MNRTEESDIVTPISGCYGFAVHQTMTPFSVVKLDNYSLMTTRI